MQRTTRAWHLGFGKLCFLSLVGVALFSFAVLADEPAVEVTKQIAANVLSRRETAEGRAVYTAEDLKISTNETLVFDEPATLYVKKLELEDQSRIDSLGHSLQVMVLDEMESSDGIVDVSNEMSQDTSGQDGPQGENGLKAADALKGAAGAHGTSGTNGGNGGDGASVSIITPRLKGNVILLTRGGDGGKGGNGGNGGRGGKGFSGSDARTLYHFKGLEGLATGTLLELGAQIGVPYVGQVLVILAIFNGLKIGDGFDGFDGGHGGNAGNGGSGGNGGKGGDVELIFGDQVAGSKILVNTRGGKAGGAGTAGLTGLGGEGGEGGTRGDIWAREGKPGQAGELGTSGAEGQPGLPGLSGKVKVTQTDDPRWLNCYVRYRQLMDLGEDREIAREVLTKCI